MSGNLHDVLYDGVNNATELDHRHLSSHTFVGSCDGLLLLNRNGEETFLIWNPSTRQTNSLPSPFDDVDESLLWTMYDLGYDVSKDDYKVVAVYCFSDKESNYNTRVEICSSKTRSWKNMGEFPHGMRDIHSGGFCNGAMHWLARRDTGSSSSWRIVSLDLANETFGEILQPVYDEGGEDFQLGALGEWLCVLCDYPGIRADVWVMKEYGVKDSWTKLVSIPYIIDPEGFRYSMPLCVTNDGKVLLQFRSELVIYDSKNLSFSEIQNFDEYSEAYTFVESVVSPG